MGPQEHVGECLHYYSTTTHVLLFHVKKGTFTSSANQLEPGCNQVVQTLRCARVFTTSSKRQQYCMYIMPEQSEQACKQSYNPSGQRAH